MSRPVLLMTLSLMVGIVSADVLFYERYEVPAWLDLAAWGCCLLVTIVAMVAYRAASVKVSVGLFVVLTVLFFAVVGFARYASYASDVHGMWQQMERPPTNRGNPDEFDYRRWRWVTQQTASPNTLLMRLRRRALDVRDRLAARYAGMGMDEEAQAIVTAVTLGDRSLLRRETRDLYAAAGVSHLLALSGLHLGIIVGLFLTWLNGRLVCSRWRTCVGVLVLLFIWTYAFVAGLPTSLVRASLMTSLFVVASLCQRRGSPLNLLVLTVFVMLLVRPVYLFDVGAQLSVAAVAGIVVLHERWMKWAFGRWRLQCFWLQRHHLMWPLTMLSVSLAAQLFTLPLVAYYFHRLPLYAPLFNLILIPLTTVLIYGALAVLLLSAVLPAVASVLAGGLSWLIVGQLALMRWETQLPGAVINDFWSRKAEPQVVVYHNRRCPALHVIAAPDRSWLLMPEPDSLETGMRSIRERFWAWRLTAAPIVLRDRTAIAIDGGFKAVMMNNGDGAIVQPAVSGPMTKREVDMLWIVRGFRGGHLGRLTEMYAPRLLVLDASLPQWQRLALHEEADRVGWRVYDVAAKGAMRFKLEFEAKDE